MRRRDIASLILSSALITAATAPVCAQTGMSPQPKAAQSKINPNLRAIAETERAFAKLGAEKGVRESFLAYFAPDGIWFTPHPKITIEELKARPTPSGPLPRKLEWAPMYGDVSRAGDFGYDTGPSRVTDLTPEKRPPRYGYFFSIWKKQPDGSWRVAIDLGTQNPDAWDPAAPPPFTAARPSGWKGRPARAEDVRPSLLAAEAAASKASQTSGIAIASTQFLDPAARFHRNDISPLVGRDDIRAFLERHDSKAHWEPVESFVARSGDLGYTYGRYWAPGLDKAGTEETGYYVHVWRKDARGDWKIVFHVTSPTPFTTK